MEKTLKIGKVSATGSFQLFLGMATSTTIMAIGTIILARLMTPEEYGLYSIALIPFYMIILFRDWGVNAAITKYTASLRAENKEEDTRTIISAGLTFEILTGTTLTLITLLLANFIATTIFHRPETTHLISIASITILSGALLIASQATFIGFERMKFHSFTMICQSILKSLTAPLLVFLGYGALGAVLGFTLSFLITGVISLTLLYLVFFKNLKKPNPKKPETFKTLKKLLYYGVPLSISSIIAGFRLQFYNFMMAAFTSDTMIGNYQIATNFAVLLTFFTFPIATVMFPAFAKLDPKNEPQVLQTVFASSVKYTAFFLVPATMAVMVLSKPMINTIFGEKWIHAPLFLTLYVTNNLLVLFGGLIMWSLLTGMGETKMLMKLSLLTLGIGIPLAFILIPTFGIIGVILGLLLAGIPSLIWGLHWTWKRYKAKADFKSSAKIFTASLIAAAITYLSISLLQTPAWTKLLTGGTIFLITYILTAPTIGAITPNDIQNLKTLLSDLGPIQKLTNIPLTITQKIANIFHENN